MIARELSPIRKRMARVTGLEPATSGVTGRRSNQLSYTRELISTGSGGGQLGEPPCPVNTTRPRFGDLFILDLLVVADMGQYSVLEQEAGDIGHPGRRENCLDDDQQWYCQQSPRRPPHPRPEA
jgi:hypothetical protein